MINKSRPILFAAVLFCSLALLTAGAWAGPADGGHWFSNDPDSGLGGVAGDIYFSPENGTNAWDWNIPLGQEHGEVDALSSGEHSFQDVSKMFSYSQVYMNYSIDYASTIMETQILNMISNSGSTVHDGAAALGSPGDLDALESNAHTTPYVHPFPNHGVDSVYFSVERSSFLDAGDIFVQSHSGIWPGTLNGTPFGQYLPDEIFAPAIGFDPDQEQLDALIVFDSSGDDAFLPGDAIFFSLAPGTFDPVGDNIYYYTETSAGLYHDPNLEFNIDALDVHVVPEPVSSTLFLVGAATLGFRRFRKKSI